MKQIAHLLDNDFPRWLHQVKMLEEMGRTEGGERGGGEGGVKGGTGGGEWEGLKEE